METRRTIVHPEQPGGTGKGFSELVREGCEGYVLQGIGLPIAAYVFHAVKLCLIVLAWMFFCSFTPGLGSPCTSARGGTRGSRFRRPSSGRA